MIKNENEPSPFTIHTFERHWPHILQLTQRLITELHISRSEWQDLAHAVYMVCSWSTNGCQRLYEALEKELYERFFKLRALKLATLTDDFNIIEAFIRIWKDYKIQYRSIPVAFQQLDLAARGTLPKPVLAPLDPRNNPNYSRINLMLQHSWQRTIMEAVMPIVGARTIASYSDILLRAKRFRSTSEEDYRDALTAMNLLINSLDSKTPFLKLHKLLLMRRLLLDQPVDQEEELNFLARIVQLEDADKAHIFHITRMFRDIGASKCFLEKFLNAFEPMCKLKPLENKPEDSPRTLSYPVSPHLSLQNNNNHPRLESYKFINVRILNPAAWKESSGETLEINLPAAIVSAASSIESFYEAENGERKLNWCHRWSNGLVEFKSPSGIYELEVMATHLTVLSSLDLPDDRPILFGELQTITGLDIAELTKALKPLCNNPKLDIQLVIANPAWSKDDSLICESSFKLNRNFTLTRNGKSRKRGRICLNGKT